MKRKMSLFVTFTVMAVLFSASGVAANRDSMAQFPLEAAELGTAFTYQGRLEDAGGPVNMQCDFQFSLFGSMGGSDQIGDTEERNNVLVEDGYFTVLNLDFGPVFWGESRYLKVAVRCPSGEGAFETLSPRQELTAAPYAMFAPNAGSVPWGGIFGIPPGLDDGDDNTIYTNGPGLTLDGNQFSVNFGGSGSASLVAHSDHNHMGQTWTGSNNPLIINGSFSTGDYAPLVLSNSYNYGDGLVVDSVGRYGMYVNSAGSDGVFVQHAESDGIYVAAAGSPGGSTWRATSSGFEVAGAEADGVFVGHAGEHGVWVSHAGHDGVRVSTAGSPAATKTSSDSNGVEVNGAEGYGLWVGYAGFDGVRIMEPADDGIQIGEGTEFPSYGLYIPEPGVSNYALWVNTAASSGNWGLYTLDNIYGGNLTASSYLLLAKVEGAGSLTPGDVVAATGITDPISGSLSRLPAVRMADSTYDGVIGVVHSRMELQLAPGKDDEGAMVLQNVPGQAETGDYVALTVLGVTDVKVDSSVVDIMPGQRLTASEFPGYARGLRTEMLGDMPVTEGAPVIGIALDEPTPGQDTIPVFITLR